MNLIHYKLKAGRHLKVKIVDDYILKLLLFTVYADTSIMSTFDNSYF